MPLTRSYFADMRMCACVLPRRRVTHSSSRDDHRNRNERKKNEKEKSVTSAVRLRHNYCCHTGPHWRLLLLLPLRLLIRNDGQVDARFNPLLVTSANFHEFSHPNYDHFLLFLLRPSVSAYYDEESRLGLLRSTEGKRTFLLHVKREEKMEPSTTIFVIFFFCFPLARPWNDEVGRKRGSRYC